MLKEYIQKPLSFSLLVLSIVIFGIYSIYTLPIKMYPDMVKPKFSINYGHPDFGRPQDLMKNYKERVDDQIKTFKGLEKFTVTYYHWGARMEIEFEWDVDEEDIKEKLERVFTPLRAESDNRFWYWLQSGTDQSSGNMMITVSNTEMESTQLQEFLQNNLSPKVSEIDNVKRVSFWGWYWNRLVFQVDRNKMLSYKLNIRSIKNKIKMAINSSMAGQLKASRNSQKGIEITILAKTEDVMDLLEIELISMPDKNLTIRLKDIGEIKEVLQRPDKIYHLNGVNANYMNVVLRSEGDVKKTCDEVENRLQEFVKEYPDFSFNIIVNPSVFIQNAINNLVVNALIGGFVAVLIILLFLGTISNTIIIGISIPFCIISSFSLMKALGVTINIISLGGMAIGVGMILDSSIVTLENIYRRLLQNKDVELSPNAKVKIVLNATKEVVLPIITSILTSIVVFLPIIFTSSYTQAILGDLAKTVVFALAVSTLAAIFIVPVASYHFLSTDLKPRVVKYNIFMKIYPYYEKLLKWIIQNKKRPLGVILCSLVIFASSLFLATKIKREIIAVPTTKLLDIRLNMQGNEDINVARKYTNVIEDYLKTEKNVMNYSTYVDHPTGGWVTIELKNRHLLKKMKKIVEDKFPDNPDVNFTAMKWDPGRLPIPRPVDVVLSVSGGTDKQISEFIDKIFAKREEINAGLRRRPWKSSKEGINVEFHPWVLDQTKGDIRDYIRASSSKGEYVTKVMEDGSNRQLYIFFKDIQEIKYIDELQNLPVLYRDKIIPLKALAKIHMQTESYVPVRYEDNNRKQEVRAFYRKNNSKLSKKEWIKKFKTIVKKVDKPMDIQIDYPDPNKEVGKSFDSFKKSLIISIALVFLIIALLFNSVRYPLIILATVPFAVTGVLGGLFISQSTISLNSMLGTILLSGLVVNNAILFIDFFIHAKKDQGMNTKDAIIEAASLRFRPIIMTTLTTLLGVVPIALGLGESGEILSPLGISIFFGLMVSTILTLFVIPSFLIITTFKSENM